MSYLKNLAIILTIGLASCKSTPPKHELCILGTSGGLCEDPREDPEEYERTFEEMINYVCTNIDDYENVRRWHVAYIKQLEDELDECRRR